MEICNKQDCTGCFSCYNACAVKAITMQENEIGHIYPMVNDAVCVSCGLCKKVCPVNKPIAKMVPKTVYASWVLNEEEHGKSSSGGLGYAFAKKTIEFGGVVYGCSSLIQAGQEITHVRCDTLESLTQLRGSKYVHSFIKDTYKQAKKDLKDGKQVLFVGTPCQIAGLKAYLNADYQNLLTVDLICHGVPPQKLFFEHVKDLQMEGVQEVSFRDNLLFRLSLKNSENRLEIDEWDDAYYVGFGKALFYRQSCYQCQYATKERVGDITLGDFWGLGKETPFDVTLKKSSYGTSVCMINTGKGREFLEVLQGELFLQERTLQEAVDGNANLRQPSTPHKNKELFVAQYAKKGFAKAAKQSLRVNFFKYKILKVINKSPFLQKTFSNILSKGL